MKKRIIVASVVVLAAVASPLRPQAASSHVAVTYVANDGFLVETAHHKVLVDALFGGIDGTWCDQPDEAVADLMLAGKPPFDRVDVVLVTHAHVDHFNEALVLKFLLQNQSSILICPDQVDRLLRRHAEYSKVAAKVRPIRPTLPFDSTLAVKDVKIRVLGLHHSPYLETDPATGMPRDRHRDVENLGYLVESDGWSFLHTGDGSTADKALYTTYKTATKRLDVAFLGRDFLESEGRELVAEHIVARNIIPMHIERQRYESFKALAKSLPRACMFERLMEEKILTK